MLNSLSSLTSQFDSAYKYEGLRGRSTALDMFCWELVNELREDCRLQFI